LPPIAWTHAAAITATVFLNFPFWLERGDVLWIPGSLLRNAAFAAAATLLLVLAFAGPALLCQATKRPFFAAVEDSVGSVPVVAIRLCCAIFVTAWIADLVSYPSARFIPLILRREVSKTESGAIAVTLVAYLFVTGLQSDRINAKLAVFVDKLGVAVLLAALIRVRHGLPAVLEAVPNDTVYSAAAISWQDLSSLVLFTGPLILLTAVFGHRLKSSRDAAAATAMGLAIPLFGTVLLISVICRAVPAAGYHRPSLSPNVAMALWSQAGSALAPRMMLTCVTIFGAVRFGVIVLKEIVRSRILLPAFGAIAAGCSLDFLYPAPAMFEVSAKCLVVVAAVITADVVLGGRPDRARRVNWVGTVALAAGLTIGLGWRPLIDDSLDPNWWHPWVLPSYVVAFVVCLAGRLLEAEWTTSPGASRLSGL
jgi:hypothetical protein